MDNIIEFSAIGKPEYLVLDASLSEIEPMLERLGMSPWGTCSLIALHHSYPAFLSRRESTLANILYTGT